LHFKNLSKSCLFQDNSLNPDLFLPFGISPLVI